MSIITLTTDFGQADGYVGIIKGVILSIAPDARLVDLSHEVGAQDVSQAAYILARAVPYFPAGTVHLVVVDPGVGSERRPMLVETPGAFFVGPDNGVLTPALDDPAAQAWELNRPETWLPAVSATFHGRDIFAPTAARLARGANPAELARRISDPVRLVMPAPRRDAYGEIAGAVISVDHFGNLITNIPAEWLSGRIWRCQIAGHELIGPRLSYSDAAEGELVVLIGSDGTLEIAARNGSAARLLAAASGEAVILQPA